MAPGVWLGPRSPSLKQPAAGGQADAYQTNEDSVLTVAAAGVLSNDSDPIRATA